MGNLTSLITLDISHNSLTDGKITEDRWGGPLGKETCFVNGVNFYKICDEYSFDKHRAMTID